MYKTLVRTAVLLLIQGLMFATALVGCVADKAVVLTGPSDPSVELLEVSESRIDTKLRRGAASIEILVHRGSERLPEWRGEPDTDSPLEADIYVSDRAGVPFLMEFGGDALLDADMAQQIEPPAANMSRYERQEDLELARDAASILDERYPEIYRQFRWEIQTIHNMAAESLDDETFRGQVLRGEPTPDLDEMASEIVDRPGAFGEPLLDDVGVSRVELATAYLHRASVRWASCCWSFGQHSAVQLRVYTADGTLLLNTVNTNNHGRSASDASMTNAAGCPRMWGGRSNYLPPLQPYRATDPTGSGNGGGCGSPYDAIPPTAGGHVCNDDSLAEYWHVKYNAASSWLTCGDSTLRASAPACD